MMNVVMLILKVIWWFLNEVVHTIRNDASWDRNHTYCYSGRKITRTQSKEVPLKVIAGSLFFHFISQKSAENL